MDSVQMAPLGCGLRGLLARTLSVTRGRGLSSSSLVVSSEVAEAVRSGGPVVTLESTIITHGMPHPANLEMALQVEDTIREAGATPATVAVIGGKIHVGLTAEQLADLATCRAPAVKTSRRDLPYVLARGLNGGTTVSGTMIASHLAGVEVFVTGGIGGVHRGATETMDISADLTELGRTPVCVVSAGVKSILDIGLTLEYLETQGVCVAVLGDSHMFPSFYTRTSGHAAPYHVPSCAEAARLVLANSALGAGSGVLLGVPIPASEAADGDRIEAAIRTAVEEARTGNICGRDVTPYVLARLNELTGGESLKANLALVKNNAKVGAGVAVELAKLKNSGGLTPPHPSSDTRDMSTSASAGSPVVVGGSIYDFVVRLAEGDLELKGGTHPGSLASSHGGVGRNVAAALARLGAGPRLVSAVGADREGRDIVRAGREAGLDTELVLVAGRTATYTAFLDSRGDCKFGVGDMAVHGRVTPAVLRGMEPHLAASPMVVCDGNLSEEAVHALLDICHAHSVPFFYEPADLSKASKPLTSPRHASITYTSPNLNELNSMLATLPRPPAPLQPLTADNVRTQVAEVGRAARQLVEHYGIQVVLVTLSEHGAVIVRRGEHTAPLPSRSSGAGAGRVSGVWYPCTAPCPAVVSVSGAGDCLTAGFITALLRGRGQAAAVSAGLQAAKLSCAVSAAVPDTMTPGDIDWELEPEQVVLF